MMPLAAREVQQIYLAYFGRPADPAGLAYWQSQTGITQVANGFAQSDEYQALYAANDTSLLVRNIYQNLFGRSPEPDGHAFWVKQLSDGDLLPGSAALAILQSARGADASLLNIKIDTAEAFTAALSLTTLAAAYKGAGPAAEARLAWSSINGPTALQDDFKPLIDKLESYWVDGVQKIYVSYLGRPADPAGLDFWVERAISLRGDWVRVAEEVSDFSEARELYDASSSAELVNAIYLNVLGREPEAAGRDYWVARLDEGSIRGGAMALAIASSTQGADTITHQQRIDAAKAFTLQLETDSRDDDYVGATVSAVAREWLYGIGPDADDLTAALQVMPDLVNAFVKGELLGVVINGYIAGATVFVDSDGNGQLDPGEVRVVSDAAGNFVFPVGRPSGAVVAIGGTNISTGLPNEAILKAPSGSAVVTPLSTLVQLMIEADLGVTPEDAENLLFAALGIPKVDLSYFDPVKYGLFGTTEQKTVALQIEAVTTQVANTLTMGGALLQGVGLSPAQARATMLDALVESIAAGPVDLAQPASLQGVLQAAVTRAALSDPLVAQANTAIGAVASVLGEINTRIDLAASEVASGSVDNTVGVLSDMFKLATLVQSELARAVEQSTADGTAEALVAEYTSANLTRNVDEVVAGNIVPGTPTNDGTTITNGGTPGGFAVVINAGGDDHICAAEATSSAALTAIVSIGTLSTVLIRGLQALDGATLELPAAYNAATNRYEFDATQFRDGPLQVIATGSRGQTAESTLILDTVAPLVPGIVSVTDDVVFFTGSIPDGGVTNDSTPSVRVSLSETLALAGGTVQLYTGNIALGGPVTLTVADLAAGYVDITTEPLANGTTYDLRVAVTDEAGNRSELSAAGEFNFTVDTSAPSAVYSIDISNDTGSLATDFITSSAAQTVTATLGEALAIGEQLYGSVDNGKTWSEITSQVSGTAINWTGVNLAGTSSIRLEVRDPSGNAGSAAIQRYTLDTSGSRTQFNEIDISDDTGSSDSDFITKTASQTITATLGSALASGEQLYGSVDNGATWTKITSQLSGTALSWSGATLAGTSSIKLEVLDAAGNFGPVATQAYTLDTTAPVTAVSDIDISADTGSSDTDFITKTASQTVTATLGSALASGEQLYGSVDNGATWTEITSQVSGTAVTWTGATLAGTSSIKLEVRDAAGNAGIAATQGYTLDTTALPGPSITQIAVDDPPSLVVDGGTTDDSTPTLRVSLAAGAATGDAVQLYDGEVALGDAVSLTADDIAAGYVDITTARLASGFTYNFRAAMKDAAGNLGALSETNEFDITVATSQVFTITERYADDSPDFLRVDMGVGEKFEVIREAGAITGYKFTDAGSGALPDTDPVVAAFLGSESSLAPAVRDAIYEGVTVTPGYFDYNQYVYVEATYTYTNNGEPVSPEVLSQIQSLTGYRESFFDYILGANRSTVEDPGLITYFDRIEVRDDGTYMVGLSGQYSVFELRAGGPLNQLSDVTLVPQIIGDFRAEAEGARVLFEAVSGFQGAFSGLESVSIVTPRASYVSINADTSEDFMADIRSIEVRVTGDDGVLALVSLSANVDRNDDRTGGQVSNRFMDLLERIDIIADINGVADMSLSTDGNEYFLRSLKTIYMVGNGAGVDRVNLSISADTDYSGDDGEWLGVQNHHYMESLESITMISDKGEADLSITTDGGNFFMESLKTIYLEGGALWLDVSADANPVLVSDDYMKSLESIVMRVNEVPPDFVQPLYFGKAVININSDGGNRFMSSLERIEVTNPFENMAIKIENKPAGDGNQNPDGLPRNDDFMKSLDRIVLEAPSGYAELDISNSLGEGGFASLGLIDVDAMNAYIRLTGLVARSDGSVTIDVTEVLGAKGSDLFGEMVPRAPQVGGYEFRPYDYESLAYIKTSGVRFNDGSTAEIVVRVGSSDLQYNAIYKMPGVFNQASPNGMFVTTEVGGQWCDPATFLGSEFIPLEIDGVTPALNPDTNKPVETRNFAERIGIDGEFKGLIGTYAADASSADDWAFYGMVLPDGWNSMGENDVQDRLVFTEYDLGRIVVGGFEHGLDHFDFSLLPILTGQVLDASDQLTHMVTAAGGILVTQVADTLDAKIWLNTIGGNTANFDDFESSIYLVGGASQAWTADDFIFATL